MEKTFHVEVMYATLEDGVCRRVVKVEAEDQFEACFDAERKVLSDLPELSISILNCNIVRTEAVVI